MDKNGLLEAVKSLAREAGAAIMDVYRQPDFGIVEKLDHTPLTLADQASNRIICEGLGRLFPRFPIISEENKAIPFEERANWDYCWLVDPLDGTKEFISRNGDFTVNIALLKGHSAEMGVVYLPALDEMYWAWKGSGAFGAYHGRVHELRAPAFSMEDTGLVVLGSRSHMNAETAAFISRLNTPELIARGSALKFLLIARGEAHLYPRMGPTMEWDTAAAQVILEEAGGSVTIADGGAPLSYNKEDLSNPFFIASGREDSQGSRIQG